MQRKATKYLKDKNYKYCLRILDLYNIGLPTLAAKSKPVPSPTCPCQRAGMIETYKLIHESRSSPQIRFNEKKGT